MAATPADGESNAISMVIKESKDCEKDQFSAFHRIGGYPWRLRLKSVNSNWTHLYLICEKSEEAEFWKFEAKITVVSIPNHDEFEISRKFTSWNKNSHELFIRNVQLQAKCTIKMKITIDEEGQNWIFPILNPLEPSPHYGILVIGDEKKKIFVNKEFLSSQSPFFDKLFNSDFKEKNMDEIPIEDVEYEEFSNVIKLVCGFAGATLHDKNFRRVLELADKYDLKIVTNKVVGRLFSTSVFSLRQKLLISEQYNLNILKEALLSQKYTVDQIKEVRKSPEWNQLSQKTLGVLFDMAFDSCDK